jgi:hypothetical protein
LFLLWWWCWWWCWSDRSRLAGGLGRIARGSRVVLVLVLVLVVGCHREASQVVGSQAA